MAAAKANDGAITPFDIEAIFPDEGNAPGRAAVKLPRKQSGNSPQELAVTLVADYTLRRRAWLPSAALVCLLCESGASEAGARTVISRLSRRGLLEGRRDGRHSAYRLPRPVAAHLREAGRWIGSFAVGQETWDGTWTLVAFSLPQEADATRRALRGQLRWRGYAPLYDALWVSPHPMDDACQTELLKLAQGAMTVFRARHVEIETVASRSPIEAWDVAAIARQYESFISRWGALVPRVESGSVTGTAAVRARTEVMDTYRRFPTLDPYLPVELMPEGWPRQEARAVFVAVYDGLAGPAEDHVRAVVDRHTPGSAPGVRAHTVAELAEPA